MKTLLIIALVAVLVCGFSSCNTISGAGRDVSAAGHGVTSSANAVKQSMSN